MRMSGDGLHVPKLAKHPLWQIFHLVGTVFESSRVNADLLKQTCSAVPNIWGLGATGQIHLTQMLYVFVWCRHTPGRYKHHGVWMLTFSISTTYILDTHTPEVLIHLSLQRRQPHVNIQTIKAYK